MLNFLLLLAIVFGVCFGITYSALSSTKTATGVISIVMPPDSCGGSGAIYYDGTNMYLEQENGDINLTENTRSLASIILVRNASDNAEGTFIKIEVSVLGLTNELSYNPNAEIATFSDSTQITLDSQTSESLIFLSERVSLYSFIYLDEIVSNLKFNSSTLTDKVLQIKISASSSSSGTFVDTQTIYYTLNVIKYTTVNLGSGTNYTATALTSQPIIGGEYIFTITMSSEVYGPVVSVDKNVATFVSKNDLVYTYKISSLVGGENITISTEELPTITGLGNYMCNSTSTDFYFDIANDSLMRSVTFTGNTKWRFSFTMDTTYLKNAQSTEFTNGSWDYKVVYDSTNKKVAVTITSNVDITGTHILFDHRYNSTDVGIFDAFADSVQYFYDSTATASALSERKFIALNAEVRGYEAMYDMPIIVSYLDKNLSQYVEYTTSNWIQYVAGYFVASGGGLG